MRELLLALHKSIVDFYRFARSQRLKSALLLTLSGMFNGWNGFQFLFFGSFMFVFVNRLSFFRWFFQLSLDVRHLIPITVFHFVTILLIFWFLHCVGEVYLNALLMRRRMTYGQVLRVTMNFAIPGLMTILFFFFLAGIIWNGIYIGYRIALSIGFNQDFSFWRWGIYLGTVALLFSMYFMMIVTDMVIPLMMHGYSYSKSLVRTVRMMRSNSYEFLAIYSLRVFSVVISTLVYIMFFRYVLFPLMVKISPDYYFNPLIVLRDISSLKDAMLNNITMTLFMLFSLVVGIPFFLPLYTVHKVILDKMIDFPLFRMKKDQPTEDETDGTVRM